MGLEANIVYLEEEIRNLEERIESIKAFLRDHPSKSMYHRRIKGRSYYYQKYRSGRKSISRFLGGEDFDHRQARKRMQGEKEKIARAKAQLAVLKKEQAALLRQLRVAQNVHRHA